MDTLGVDSILVGGDVASGPMPAETLALLRARDAVFVRGNADRVLDLETGSASSMRAASALRTRRSRAPTGCSPPTDLELRRTEYDVEAAVARIAATGYPRRSIFEHELGVRDPERPARIAAIIEGGS